MKYTIDGNIDFFAELYKSLDEKDDIKDTDEGKCLITQEPLNDKFVKLKCGHTFNYIPLFKDILAHKYLYNNSEDMHSKLLPNEIRCPFCRKKQYDVLPYYEELGLDKIKGVNEPAYFSLSKCLYKTPNKYYNPNIPDSFFNAKENDCLCVPTDIIDNKIYCYKHHLKIVKQKMKDGLLQQKKEAKQKMIEEKLKLKEEKEKQKQEKKSKTKPKTMTQTIGENIVISQQQTCIAILKTGERKGQCCGNKLYKDNLCKRHTIIKDN